jgi:hypothetical protein
MTRDELDRAFQPVLALIKECYPDEELMVDKLTIDFGFTIGVGIKSAMRVIEAHAWSWDGKFDPCTVETFLTNPKGRGRTLHLGSPKKPNESNGVVVTPGVLPT